MRPKRLLFTVTNDLTYDQRMIRICTTLSRAGYDVCLIGRRRRHSEPLRPGQYPFRQKRLFCFFEKGKLFYLEYNLRLFCLLLTTRFDLVCSIDLDTILPGFLVARLRRKIQVYDAHEYFTELPEVVHRPLVRGIWRLVACLTIPRIRYAYTVGESLARIFEKAYGTPFEVIRNVPIAQKRPPGNFAPQKTSPPILLYQGALNDGRGLEAIIEALPGIPDALLWLVGEGDLSEKLRAMANARPNLRHRIRFWGYQKPEDLRNITPQATLGLNLLENKGLNYYYSLANKAFDYMQAGLPSVNMQFPEYQRINEQADVFLLVPDLRVSTLQDAINGLLSDPHRYHQMRENCTRAAARFTWEKEEKKLLDFYRKTGV